MVPPRGLSFLQWHESLGRLAQNCHVGLAPPSLWVPALHQHMQASLKEMGNWKQECKNSSLNVLAPRSVTTSKPYWANLIFIGVLIILSVKKIFEMPTGQSEFLPLLPWNPLPYSRNLLWCLLLVLRYCGICESSSILLTLICRLLPLLYDGPEMEYASGLQGPGLRQHLAALLYGSCISGLQNRIAPAFLTVAQHLLLLLYENLSCFHLYGTLGIFLLLLAFLKMYVFFHAYILFMWIDTITLLEGWNSHLTHFYIPSIMPGGNKICDWIIK